MRYLLRMAMFLPELILLVIAAAMAAGGVALARREAHRFDRKHPPRR